MTRADRLAFIAKMAPTAKATERKTGIPASVTIAQAILESSWGQSKEASECCNYFGIKARQGQDYAEFKTGEIVNGKPITVTAKFRKFPSIPDSFAAHADLISKLPRYKPAMDARENPYQFATLLQACGYSTNPKYGLQIERLINEFGLTQYDTKEAA